MEIGGLSAQAVGSMRVAVLVVVPRAWFNEWNARVVERGGDCSCNAVEVSRMDSVSRWVGGPPFCCWSAEVRSREHGQGQIVSRHSGVASVRSSGPCAPGVQRCFSKTPRLQDSTTPTPSRLTTRRTTVKFWVEHKTNVAVGHVISVLL